MFDDMFFNFNMDNDFNDFNLFEEQNINYKAYPYWANLFPSFNNSEFACNSFEEAAICLASLILDH